MAGAGMTPRFETDEGLETRTAGASGKAARRPSTKKARLAPGLLGEC
jgi:hypothetical protein